MSLSGRFRTLFRMFLLFTVLAAVALISAITTIRLSIRGHQETTPSVVGMSLEKAQQLASGLGLEVVAADKLFSTQYLPNEIISQQPAAETPVKVGQQIHVIVSLGPPQVTVPNLVGATVRAAQITAIQRGLSVGSVAAVHEAGTEADEVLAQDPPPLTTDVHSPAVDFLVSLGEQPPAYLCPSFLGQLLPDARRALEGAGFKIGQVTPFAMEGVVRDTIIGQTPRPGSMIGPDAVFSFQVVE
jgi:eukaryotic-like serine/threonine-protein kinase